MTTRLAFVGIGQMGAGMALSLQRAGFSVTGFDVSAASRAAAKAQGLPVTEDLAQALEGVEFILSSLPNSAITAKAWLGPEGILAKAKGRPTCIDLSTIDARTMVTIGEACRAKGFGVIDAPVSGGPNEAAAGKLVLMIGGDMADVARAKPVLEAIGSVHLPTGDIGTAKTVKLVNNVMSMGNILIAAEAFALGTAAGVAPQALFDALSQSGGRSHHFLKRFQNAVNQNWDPGFKMELGVKDMSLALDFARDQGQPMPIAAVIREMMALALATGFEGKDVVAAVDMYQSMQRRDAATEG